MTKEFAGLPYDQQPFAGQQPETPVQQDGNTLLLDTERMVVGQPYHVLWRGEDAVVFKEPDGNITVSRIGFIRHKGP